MDMTLTGDMLEKKAARYYHFILFIIIVDLIINLLFMKSFTQDPINMDFLTKYAILEFIFLAAIIYCFSTRNQCLKELKEENAKHQVS
jgi:NADH:ubiquinone oxidoreductase subunit 3 (subunit A)